MQLSLEAAPAAGQISPLSAYDLPKGDSPGVTEEDSRYLHYRRRRQPFEIESSQCVKTKKTKTAVDTDST